MLEAAERERPDELVHLGDCLSDAEELSYAFPGLPMTRVPGNCDGWTGLPDRVLLERQGVRVLLAHGHQWRVKSGPDLALSAAREARAGVLLYGHTHRAACRREGALWVMNPGTIGGRRAPPTYGVLVLDKGSAVCALRRA